MHLYATICESLYYSAYFFNTSQTFFCTGNINLDRIGTVGTVQERAREVRTYSVFWALSCRALNHKILERTLTMMQLSVDKFVSKMLMIPFKLLAYNQSVNIIMKTSTRKLTGVRNFTQCTLAPAWP